MEDLKNENQDILRLELDIDGRLLNLWQELGEMATKERWEEELLEKVSAYMRAAYGKGYCDAITETPEDHGRLVRDHGYRIPWPRPLPLDPEI